MHLPPGILRRLEDEDRDCSWYDPHRPRRGGGWWRNIDPERRAAIFEAACHELRRKLRKSEKNEANLQAENDALRAQLLGDATRGGSQ